MTVHQAVATGRTATEAELTGEAAHIEHARCGNRFEVAEPENAAGRPVEALITSHRHIQSEYGPAAPGKPRRSR
jgi:hypothetical protein